MRENGLKPFIIRFMYVIKICGDDMDFSTHYTLIPLAMPLPPPMFCFAVTLNAYGITIYFKFDGKNRT